MVVVSVIVVVVIVVVVIIVVVVVVVVYLGEDLYEMFPHRSYEIGSEANFVFTHGLVVSCEDSGDRVA